MTEPEQQLTGGVRIGVDVGGTFTDLVVSSDGHWLRISKVPSVPGDPAAGVEHALEQAAAGLNCSVGDLLGRCELFVHGSTIATNTVLEGKGARVGLITTAGFRDSLEIRRGIRPDPWAHRDPYAPVLVPRYRRLGVPGRLDAQGIELEALDQSAVHAAGLAFADDGVEAVAICLFNSYANDAHEQACARALAGAFGDRAAANWISLSSEVLPVLGEYERSTTTVLNAYVAPRTVGYLRKLEARLKALGLPGEMLLIQNNGGSIPTAQVASRPVNLLLSGPAAGTGALAVAREQLGEDNLLSLEIGGTSADVMLLESGKVPVSEQLEVGGYHCAVPSVDIHTIGAGGGTIARVDAAGMLQVGPDGAGANPGPAAYGLGGELPTVTDALLVLGRLTPGTYAGGAVTLDVDAATAAIDRHVATPLGLDVRDAAVGVIRLLEQNLLQAVEQVTLERGLDPRTFTLVPAGGAGPMHGAAVGRRLGCRRLYIPGYSGAFCALGMLQVDVRHDAMRSFFHPLDEAVEAGMAGVFAELEAQVAGMLSAEGFDESARRVRREADLRYAGQQWSLRVPVRPDDDEAAMRAAFESVHESRYRHIQPDGLLEITALHVTGLGLIPDLRLPTIGSETELPIARETREVYVDDEHGWQEAGVYEAIHLRAGHEITGPAIVEAQTTTLCIGPGDRLTVDETGSFVVALDATS